MVHKLKVEASWNIFYSFLIINGLLEEKREEFFLVQI